MLERPERKPIEQSYQVVVSDQGVQSVRLLSSEELRSVTGWRMGWCCSQGQVFESSSEDCWRRRGYFSYDENDVRERCQPRLGWCCSQGQVLESSPEDCKRRRGFFSYNENDVRERCRETSVDGYCCRAGEVFQSERAQCLRRGGQFYFSYGEAHERCRSDVRILPELDLRRPPEMIKPPENVSVD